MRAPVLIIGAHRSGTSATAAALERLGLRIGQRLDSHWEPRGLQRVHEEYLHRVGAAWHNPQPLIDWLQTESGDRHCVAYLRNVVGRDFSRTFGYRTGISGLWPLMRIKIGAPWGWKEPRTTLFAAAWLKIFPEAKILHVMRHPLDVALSTQRRELRFREAGDPPNSRLDDLATCLQVAMTYVECAEATARLTDSFHRVRFEDLQAKPAATLTVLAEFCGLNSSRVAHAAAGIRPDSAGRWRDLPAEVARELLASHALAAQLGYNAMRS
jgi:hypothetical protein